jgi:hypothetical protein
MYGFPPSDEIDRAIGAMADRQYGVVSRGRLMALGLAPGRIDYRLAAGRLFRLHRGVYAVGHRHRGGKLDGWPRSSHAAMAPCSATAAPPCWGRSPIARVSILT